MALIFDADGHPVFIPTQRGRRARASAPSRGKLIKHPLLGWHVHYEDGAIVKAGVQRAKEKGVRLISDPRTGEVLEVTRPSRRRRKLRKIVGKYLLNPYILGALTGFGLPKVLSASHTVLAGTGIAVAGYFSPTGSYVRRFSIGAGLGAGLQAGLEHSELIGEAAALASQVADVALAIPGQIEGLVQAVKPVTDVIDILTPGTAAHMHTGALRFEAQRKLRKKYGGSIWRRLTGNPVQ